MRLQSKICLVTGGGSGIGEAICRRFAQEGALVGVLDIDMNAALRVANSLDGAVALSCDVASSSSVNQAFTRALEKLGRIDVVVNNAGMVGREYTRHVQRRIRQLSELRDHGKTLSALRVTEELTDEEWDRMVTTHLNGTFYCSRAAMRAMDRVGGGVIINMASINGIDGGHVNPHYAAVKAGIIGFTRALSKEAIVQGIRVNVLAPGFVETPLRHTIDPLIQQWQIAATPIGRAALPEEIANAALFLASDESSYFVGQTLSPNGGYLTV